MWMTSCSEAMDRGLWVIFERKLLVEIWSWTKRVDFWTWARPVELSHRDAPCVVGSDGSVSIVETVSLSLVSKNLKVWKVIKVSYLNYRESLVFRVFFRVLCIMIISHIRILWLHLYYILIYIYIIILYIISYLYYGYIYGYIIRLFDNCSITNIYLCRVILQEAGQKTLPARSTIGGCRFAPFLVTGVWGDKPMRVRRTCEPFKDRGRVDFN